MNAARPRRILAAMARVPLICSDCGDRVSADAPLVYDIGAEVTRVAAGLRLPPGVRSRHA